MIGGVIFDLDGVVRHWPPDGTRSIERRHRLPEGSIDGVAFEPERLTRAITGQVPDSEWRAEVSLELAALHGSPGRAAAREWASLSGEVDVAVLELVRDARGAVRVALLTNATSRLAEDLAALGLEREFDVVVSSADLRRAKPDPRVFEHAAEVLGIPCAGCVVVDDEAVNVASAHGVGMAGIRHRNALTTRRRLVAMGLWSQAIPAGGR